jgi:hypothetical protein
MQLKDIDSTGHNTDHQRMKIMTERATTNNKNKNRGLATPIFFSVPTTKVATHNPYDIS